MVEDNEMGNMEEVKKGGLHAYVKIFATLAIKMQ